MNLVPWMITKQAEVKDEGKYYSITFKYERKITIPYLRMIDEWYLDNYPGRVMGSFHRDERKHFIYYIKKEIEQREAKC